MNADERSYKHTDVTGQIISTFYQVYRELGFGFLESVYREAMAIALGQQGFESGRSFHFNFENTRKGLDT